MANTYGIILARDAGQYAFHANQTAYQITSDLTIETWINLTSVPTSSNTTYTICSKYGNTDQSYLVAVATDSSNVLSMFMVINSGGANESFYFPYTFLINTCYHVAFVYTASSARVDFYVNATFIGSVTKTNTSITNSTAEFEIGSFRNGTEAFDGEIDDLRLWAMARTAAQILTNYQRELAGNETSLNAYYKFNNNYNDSTSNGNTLTPSGLPTFTTDVCFADTTTTSTSTTSTSSSTTTTSTSTSTTTTSTSTTSTSSSTSSSTSITTSTSTTSTITTTSTSKTTTSTSTTTTSTSTTTTSTSTSTTTTTSTSSTTTLDLRLTVEKFA